MPLYNVILCLGNTNNELIPYLNDYSLQELDRPWSRSWCYLESEMTVACLSFQVFSSYHLMLDYISNENIFKYNTWVPLANYDSNLKAKEEKHEFILTLDDKHVTHKSTFPLK